MKRSYRENTKSLRNVMGGIGGLVCMLCCVASLHAHIGSQNLEQGLVEKAGSIIFFEDFEDVNYAASHWQQNSSANAYRIASDLGQGDAGSHALRVMVQQGEHYGLDWEWKFSDWGLDESTELYFRYYIRLGSSWTHSLQSEIGKLPGFGGTYDTAGYGGIPATGDDGWSARVANYQLVTGDVELGYYAYYADMLEQSPTYLYGHHWHWGTTSYEVLHLGQWHCVEGYVKLNSVSDGEGNNDGVVRGWVDGNIAYEKTGIDFRDVEDLKIECFWFETYVGGSWTAEHDMWVDYDNIVLSTEYIGPLIPELTGPRELYKYDDFNDPAVSPGLWTIQSDTPSAVVLDGGWVANLWMRDGRPDAYTRALSTTAFQLADASDSLKVGFDYKHVWSSTVHDHQGGLGVVYGDGTHIASTGSYGRASNYVDRMWKNFVGVGSPFPGSSGSARGTSAVFGEYHYEMTLTTTSVDVDVYALNSAWDAIPDMYSTDATPIESFSLAASANAGTDLYLSMWHFSPDAVDPWTDGDRGGSVFDNVYVNRGGVQIPGDANGDGSVDVGDLGILAANYGGTGKSWTEGDFNGDGNVDVGDLGILAANYGTGSSSANFDVDYAKVFGEASDAEENDESLCSGLGLPLIAGLLLVGLMLVKLED